MEYYSAIKKTKGSSAIYNNMDKYREHYSKWKKPDKERQILTCGI